MPKNGLSPTSNASDKEDKKLTPNPVMCREGRGVRLFSCEYYDFCLDKAAKGMWSGFTCAQCPFYQQSTQEEKK